MPQRRGQLRADGPGLVLSRGARGDCVRFAPGRALDPEAYPSGGAGMVGTARDFLVFLEMLRTGGAPILSLGTPLELAVFPIEAAS